MYKIVNQRDDYGTFHNMNAYLIIGLELLVSSTEHPQEISLSLRVEICLWFKSWTVLWSVQTTTQFVHPNEVLKEYACLLVEFPP